MLFLSHEIILSTVGLSGLILCSNYNVDKGFFGLFHIYIVSAKYSCGLSNLLDSSIIVNEIRLFQNECCASF